jgi:hypothetical protein
MAPALKLEDQAARPPAAMSSAQAAHQAEPDKCTPCWICDSFRYGFKGAPAARQPSGLRPDWPRGIAKPRGERVDLDAMTASVRTVPARRVETGLEHGFVISSDAS